MCSTFTLDIINDLRDSLLWLALGLAFYLATEISVCITILVA
jgi:hypothetical protein